MGAPTGEVELPFEDLAGSQGVDLSTGAAERKTARRSLRRRVHAERTNLQMAELLPAPASPLAGERNAEPASRRLRKGLTEEGLRMLETFPVSVLFQRLGTWIF